MLNTTSLFEILSLENKSHISLIIFTFALKTLDEIKILITTFLFQMFF